MSSRPFPTPALDAWRAELAAGRRTRETLDPLWRAASAESLALEWAHVPPLAAAYREDARRIVREALKEQGRA